MSGLLSLSLVLEIPSRNSINEMFASIMLEINGMPCFITATRPFYDNY